MNNKIKMILTIVIVYMRWFFVLEYLRILFNNSQSGREEILVYVFRDET